MKLHLLIALVCIGCSESAAVAPSFDAGSDVASASGAGGAGSNDGTGGAPATGGIAGSAAGAPGTGGSVPVSCATLAQVTGTFQGTEWTDLYQDFTGCPGPGQGRQPSFDVSGGVPTSSTDQGVMSLANASGPVTARAFSSVRTDGGGCSFTVQYDWPTPLGDGTFGAGVGQPECGNAHAIVTGTVAPQ